MNQDRPIIRLRSHTPKGESQHLMITINDRFILFDNRILTASTGLVHIASFHRAFRFGGKTWHYCKQLLFLTKNQYLSLKEILEKTNPIIGLADDWFKEGWHARFCAISRSDLTDKSWIHTFAAYTLCAYGSGLSRFFPNGKGADWHTTFI